MIHLIAAYIAGLLKGWMDTMQFHWSSTPKWMKDEQFWNPSKSWRNKYKDIDGDGIGDVAGGAKHFLSKTVLVFYTDGWHLFQMLYLVFIALSVVLFTPTYHLAIEFVLFRLALWAGFQSTYR